MNRSKLLNVLMVSLGLSLLQPLSALAGTITITDLTDSASISLSSDVTTRGAIASCIGEVCTAFIPAPSGAGSSADVSFAHHDLLEPGSRTISDIEALTQVNDPTSGVLTGFNLTFTSDSETGLGTSDLQNDITETGLPQDDGFVDWGDATEPTIDSIIVQSDLDPPTGVPEPISLILFGAGLMGMGALRRKLLTAPGAC